MAIPGVGDRLPRRRDSTMGITQNIQVIHKACDGGLIRVRAMSRTTEFREIVKL